MLNYIRFWQADGESEKTSVRTRTSLRQLVEEGHFKGGSAPYGYDLVKSGRINKRKHELYELHINEREAAVKSKVGGCIGTACKSQKTVQAKQCSPKKTGFSKKKSTVLSTKYGAFLVENSGIEPLTSCMPCKRSPS